MKLQEKMTIEEVPIVSFLKKLMRRRRRSSSQLAADLGVSYVTIFRWLSGRGKPNIRSCRKLAEYSGVPAHKVVSIVLNLPGELEQSDKWPGFGEYARRKYPKKLDEDEIAVIEDLIERRRQNRLS